MCALWPSFTPLALVAALIASCSLTACAFGGDQGDDGFVLSSGGDELGDMDTGTGTDSEGGDADAGTTSSTDTTTTDTTTDGGETTTTSDTTTDGGETTTTTTGGPDLPCDPGFDIIQPNPAIAGQPFTARYTDTTPHTYIGMSAAQIEGVGSPIEGAVTITDDGPNGPWHWSYPITGHGAGVVELTFSSGNGANILGTCQVEVI